MTGLTPCRIIQSKRYAFLKRRIRPLRRMRNKAMLYRIEMNIIHMCAIIPLIANGMFPKAFLPNSPPLTRQNLRPYQFHIWQRLRKPFLDRAPAAGIIRIIFRHGPYAMHVVRQNHPCIRMKRRQQENRADRGPERFDFPHQQVRPAVCQVYREEIRSSRNAVAAIVGHCGNVSTFLTWRNRFVRGRWKKSVGTMRIGAVARQPKMARSASLFRPCISQN